MARAPSKILSVAEKKQAEAGLKQAIKLVDTGVTASGTEVATATKALAAAKKQADALVATASKTVAAAQKEGDKLVSAAQKALDAATKKHTKVLDAAGKGRDKLNSQLATLAATPAEPAKRGPKVAAPATA